LVHGASCAWAAQQAATHAVRYPRAPAMTLAPSNRRLVVGLAAVSGGVLCVLGLWGLWVWRESGETAQAREPKTASVVHREQPPTRFVAAAGGSTPDSNPVSLEQNIALAHAVLPGPGVLLFGSGPEGTTVQVLDPELPRDPLLQALGELFAPRAGRDSRYQSTSLPAASATAAAVRTELSIALARRGPPLLLYISGHGDQAESPRDNPVHFWGGEALSAVDLAELHDRAPGRRELRAVITSCFSGGFAELAFASADNVQGVTKHPRCGLFATTSDLESSGCDPNPDRAQQEGYSLHFFNALRGMDRDGHTPVDVDFDHDGKVSLLEAHARATLASRSIDVPTTTSERFLREHVSAIEPETLPSPEDDAVIAALNGALSLSDEAQAREALGRVEAELDEAEQALTEAQSVADTAYNALAMSLLSRWPVIDDPWHPLFATTLQNEHDTILKALAEDEVALTYTKAQDALQQLDDSLATVQARYSLLARLVRAHDNRHLAASLKRIGGKPWTHYEQLLQCERGLP